MSCDDFERHSQHEQERERGGEARRREREAYREERREARERRHGRKERVLHTRISDRLAEDIRNVADELRVPVSNLVRNVLEDVFSVAEVVGDNVGELVEDVLEEADRAADRLARRSRRHGYASARFERRRGEAEDLRADRRPEGDRPEAAPEFPEVLGWQRLLLNRAQRCERCGRGLERGEQAFLGLTAGGPGTIWLCRACAP